MTNLAPAAATPRRAALAPLIVLATAGGAVAGFALGRWSGVPTAGWDPHLLVLLRFMAAVKLAGVAAAAALTLWRVRRPLPIGAAIATVVALAAMALAPGLIWSLAHVGLAAMAFHGGLLTLLVLAWRDDRLPVRRRAVDRRAINPDARSTAPYDHPTWNAGPASPFASRN